MKSNDTLAGGLLGINLAAAGVTRYFTDPDNLVKLLVSLGQVGVAVMTIYYFWRKSRAIKLPSECPLKTKKKRKRC